MAGKGRDISDFFKPYARQKRPLSSSEDPPGLPPHRTSKPHVLLPPSPHRPRKAQFTASAKLQRESSPSFSSSPLSEPPPDLLSDDAQPNAGSLGVFEQSDTSPDPAETGKAKTSPAVVKNSDDDDSSSTSSLADLDQLLRGFAKPKAPPIPPSPGDGDTIRVDTSGIRRNTMPKKIATQSRFGTGSQLRLKGSARAPKKYGFSLKDLVTQTERDEADEIGVAKAKSLLDSGQARQRGPSTQGGIEDGSNKALLTSVVAENDESYNMQRVLDAMKRTEAFDQELTWSFFEDSGTPQEELMDYFEDDYDFPLEDLKSRGWASCLIERETRTRAFLSGFVAEKAMSSRIPHEILQWTLEKVATEPREDLRHAYITVIKGVPSALVPKIIQKQVIDGLFNRLNAKSEAVDPEAEIVPQPPDATDRPRDWSKLISVLSLLGSVAHKLDESTREHALHLLLRLSVDAQAMSKIRVSRATEHTIANFASTFHNADDLSEVCKVVYYSVSNTLLRRLLIRHLPPSTPTLSALRSRLALSFFFSSPALLTPTTTPSITLINTHLRRRRLILDDTTDYTELAALAYMLDAAIDRGRSTAAVLDRAAEKAFNAEVDVAAERIKGMFISMADSGASHLKRTEAKERFEALYYRLIYAVRTRPPPKLDVFGGGDGDEVVRSGAFMEKFLGRKKAGEED